MHLKRENILPLLAFLALIPLYFRGLAAVPFHPDEATFLFTSQDFELFLQDPLSLAWEPGQEAGELVRYRLLDEPLNKLAFGLARRIAGIPAEAVDQDWYWSKSWEQNRLDGALPETRTLAVARAASSLFSFASLVVLYLAVRRHMGWRQAFAFLVLFGLSGLVLLHGRRAMREGLMLLALSILVAALPYAGRRPWAAGLAAALALSARYFLAPLVPLAFALSVYKPLRERDFHRAARNGAAFAAAFAALFLALQPVLWKHPVQGALKMAEMRLAFSRESAAILSSVSPEQLLDSGGERIGALLYLGFAGPLSYYEVGNYAAELAAPIAAYEKQALYHLWRGPVWGGLFLFLFLGGISLSVYRAYRLKRPPSGFWLAVALAASLETAFILAGLEISAQRYYVVLTPLYSILAASLFGGGENPPEPPAAGP